MTIDEIGYVEELRQRLGLAGDDDSKDSMIERMEPFQRVRMIAGWYLGDSNWGDTFKDYCESQGVYLTIDADANGII